MLNRIFPKLLDDRYRGHKFALWLLYPLTFMNVGIALVAIFAKDGGAQSADGIPLDSFGASGAEAVIGVLAFLGLAKLLLGMLAVLALFRYRAMIPLMYLLIVLDHVAHKGIALMKPIIHAGGSTGGYVNLAILAVSVTGLVLSVMGKGYISDSNSK